jgi:DNA-binding phage protein
MTKAKGLQKLSESEVKINTLFTQEKPITGPDVRALKFSTDEVNDMVLAMYAKINSLDGSDLDDFLEKVNILLSDDTRSWLWENNHNNITAAISNLMHEKNRMPSKSEIANETKLSRQTIHKHLNEYSSHPLYLQQVEQFRFLTTRLLVKVYNFACDGDVGAAKLYFNVLGYLNGQNSNKTLIQNQHNFIQINGIILSQESVKKLNPEQLETIESILKTALPEAEKIEL